MNKKQGLRPCFFYLCIMNYEQTLDYLYSQLPMFQRIGAAAYKADLNSTYALLKVLGNPHRNFRSVHIAGTNGKGSVSHMIASVLQEAGYKTGLYTSPHLKDFRERIRINGKMIPKSRVVSFVKKHKNEFQRIGPSFFEMTVGMAFNHFEKENVDIAILETGMGGRLDSTNVVQPELSVITNISFDHTTFLGDTLEKIAEEKAGIIKENTPVVIGELQEETQEVFLKKAAEKTAIISFADQNLAIQFVDEFTENDQLHYLLNISKGGSPYLISIELPLTGYYQFKNLLTTLQSLEILTQRNYRIRSRHIYQGIKKVKENTGFLGRWLILSRDPLTICDIAHNLEGIRNILEQIKGLQYEQLHFVLGMVNDKDINKILDMLPEDATYYFCKADIPRGLDAKKLQSKAALSKLKGNSFESVDEAFKAAKTAAHKNDLIFIGGSTFTVAEVL